MELDFLTIDQVISILSKETGIQYETQNIADLVMNNSLEPVFWFDGYIGELHDPFIENGIDDCSLAKLSRVKDFLKPFTAHKQDIYDLMLNEKIAIDISLVHKEQRLSVILSDCSEDLINEVLSYTRYDEKKKQLINEAVLVENFPLMIHDLTSKGTTASMQLTINKLRITKESIDRYIAHSKATTLESETVEITSDKAIAIMAMMLSEQSSKFKYGDRPNATQIGEEIYAIAQQHFKTDDLRGLESFKKRISRAFNTYQTLTNPKK
ncbi:TPA: hypothetical protein U9I94_001723 [Acinetobacter baumannii]|uniref:hypothetical protein n=1 Tax=Acinetobacter baumannii TaxID=470 RepID=UPI0013D89C00|nr:hypothetical protein [Acinetobacter baumannii]HEN9570768.1 hypothetical protein [Acinetobacter baumannii]HEN9600996.1 hypothetical protein [Acinetobacter baumannii]